MGTAGFVLAAGRGGAGRCPRTAGAPACTHGVFLYPQSFPASVASAPIGRSRRMMGRLGVRRGLEWLLGFYFLSHIPLTLLVDMQALLPPDLYPVEVRAPSVLAASR